MKTTKVAFNEGIFLIYSYAKFGVELSVSNIIGASKSKQLNTPNSTTETLKMDVGRLKKVLKRSIGRKDLYIVGLIPCFCKCYFFLSLSSFFGPPNVHFKHLKS